jgi:cell division protein FtsW
MSLIAVPRTERHLFADWWWTVDRGMLATVFLLMGLGIALVMTASPAVATRLDVNAMHFAFRHILVLIPSALMMIGLSLMTPRMIWRVATCVLFLGMIAMVLVLFTGMEIKGAQRWINLPGFSLQPSEFVKPAFAVFAAWLMARQVEQPKFPGYGLAIGVYAVIATLLMMQPDLGMTFVLTFIIGTQLVLVGVPLRYLFGLVGLAMFGILIAYSSFDHVHSRINRFLDPSSGDTYQIEKSIEAFENGGLTGQGPGQGTVKLTIPDAHADFIFSVGAEEFGFFFVPVLLAMYGFILWRGFQHMMNTQDMFTILACGGLLVMFGLQAFVHMGSAMNILPTKGMTLPFISYGGSSLLSMGFAFGIILALTRRSGKSSISRGGVSSLMHETKLWS